MLRVSAAGTLNWGLWTYYNPGGVDQVQVGVAAQHLHETIQHRGITPNDPAENVLNFRLGQEVGYLLRAEVKLFETYGTDCLNPLTAGRR